MSVNVLGSIRDGLLEQGMVSYQNDQAQFIADRLFPRMPVDDKKGDWYELLGGFGAATPDMALYRSAGASYKEIDVDYSLVSGWNVNDFGLGVSVDKKAARYAAGGQSRLAVRMDAGMRLASTTQVIRERIAAGLINATVFSGYTTALSGRDQFSDDTSDVLARVQTTTEAVEDGSGISPNAVQMSIEVARRLARHPQLIEHYSRTIPSIGRGAGLNGATLVSFIADLWDVDPSMVFIGSAYENTANAGQTESLSRIWSDNVLLFRHQASPSPRTPQSALCRFQLVPNAMEPLADEGTVRRWDDGSNPLIERISQSWDEQFSAPRPKLGHLLTDVLA